MQIRIIYILLITILFSCSTEKDRGINRAFHNTNSYFNGYFNAQEIMKETNKEFVKVHKDDFSQILPVYAYPDDDETDAFNGPMEQILEKCSRVIHKHAMPHEKKGRYTKIEYGNWIDESWNLMGQAYFYRHDYEEAEEVFMYVQKVFEKDPSKYEAKLWRVKSYLQQGKIAEANAIMSEVVVEREAYENREKIKEESLKKKKNYQKRKGKKSTSLGTIKDYKEKQKKKEAKSIIAPFPEELESQYNGTLADLYIKQEKYDLALVHLKKCLETTKGKQNKIRMNFVLAQLYQKDEQNKLALEHYKLVQKKAAPHQMLFYAKMNTILLGGEKKEKSKVFKKMLRDIKFEEFKDQIYYAMAEHEFENGQDEKANEYLKKSIAEPISNKETRMNAYLILANNSYDNNDFIQAQKYYDSTLNVLPKDHPEYSIINSKKIGLDVLVKNINTYKETDKKLRWAELDEKALLKEIEKEIEDEIKAERDAQIKSAPKPNDFITPAGSTSDFYIWSPQLRQIGAQSFRKKWGEEIALEDNWRRKDKSSINIKINDINSGEEKENNSIESYKLKIAEKRKEIPTSEKEKSELRAQLTQSVIVASQVYKETLNDKSAAKNLLNEVATKYPNKEEMAPIYYELYLQNQSDDKYKNLILNNYPNSKYAKAIVNPESLTNTDDKQNKEETAYKKVFDMYTYGQYQSVILASHSFANSYPTSSYICKYMFLEAMSLSELGLKDSTAQLLTAIVKQCPDSEIAKKAQSILNHENIVLGGNNKVDEKTELYEHKPQEKHFYAIIMGVNESKDAQKLVSDYNIANHSSKGIKSTSILYDKENIMVIVKEFKNYDKVIKYAKAFEKNENLQDLMIKPHFPISASNFKKLLSTKKLEEYFAFLSKIE